MGLVNSTQAPKGAWSTHLAGTGVDRRPVRPDFNLTEVIMGCSVRCATQRLSMLWGHKDGPLCSTDIPFVWVSQVRLIKEVKQELTPLNLREAECTVFLLARPTPGNSSLSNPVARGQVYLRHCIFVRVGFKGCCFSIHRRHW